MTFHFKYARGGCQEVRDKGMGRKDISSLTFILWTKHNAWNFEISVNLHGNPMKSKLQLQIYR